MLEDTDGSIEKCINYKLNSVFPVKISGLPKGAKIGDWITVVGEANLYIPRHTPSGRVDWSCVRA